MKKLVTNRKAVSPVLSAVLMILVVITGMSLLFAFFVNYARDFQMGSGSAVLEGMTVEDVWFREPPTRAEVWVYNFGKVDFRITSVYVNDNWVIIDPVEVGVGEHELLTVRNYGFVFRNSYSFKIVTERGTAFEGRYVWQ